MSAKVAMYPSGNLIDLMNPDASLIEIEDIAHALSMLPRWTGATRFPYTVAQHSIWCFQNVPGLELGFQALMHDATEAFMNDLAKPVKNKCPNYQLMEGRLWHEIARKYGLPEILDPRVKHVDAQALISERVVLKGKELVVSSTIKYQHWTKTKKEFLSIFYMLQEKLQLKKSA